MTLEIKDHPLVGKILRSRDNPNCRIKVVGVRSGAIKQLWWCSPGASPDTDLVRTSGNWRDFEIDPDQTDGVVLGKVG